MALWGPRVAPPTPPGFLCGARAWGPDQTDSLSGAEEDPHGISIHLGPQDAAPFGNGVFADIIRSDEIT